MCDLHYILGFIRRWSQANSEHNYNSFSATCLLYVSAAESNVIILDQQYYIIIQFTSDDEFYSVQYSTICNIIIIQFT